MRELTWGSCIEAIAQNNITHDFYMFIVYVFIDTILFYHGQYFFKVLQTVTNKSKHCTKIPIEVINWYDS